MANTLTPVEFHGATLSVILINGVPHVALRPICEAIGIDWQAQHARIKRHPVLGSVVSVTKTTGTDGKQYEMLMFPLDKLDGWLFGVSVRRVRPELRERLTQYQGECFDALARHFGSAAPRQDSDATKLISAQPLALSAPRLSAEAMAALDARAGQIAGSAYAEMRQWLLSQVLAGCVRPDGTPAPNFAATLADADFAAFTTNYANKQLDTIARMLQFIQQESGALIGRVDAERQKLDRQAQGGSHA